jgi:23S rRNA (cytosine1962-C5)-methyltransferase
MTLIKGEWIEPVLVRAFESEGTDAYRLCTADTGFVERFAGDVLISYQNERTQECLAAELETRRTSFDFEIRRVLGRSLPKKNEERAKARLLAGVSDKILKTVATERRLKFGIDFEAGYSAGLFLDQRENRSFVRQIAAARLLNCFAYTCSFSVAAASVGTETVNVDLSRKWLARGKTNFELNGLPVTGHRFIEDDVRPVLRRMARRGDTFDAIILDPPTFAHSIRLKAFRVERDFEELIVAALEVAARKAHILLSTNCSSIDAQALQRIATRCLAQTKRSGKFYRSPHPVDFSAGAGATNVWLSLH